MVRQFAAIAFAAVTLMGASATATPAVGDEPSAAAPVAVQRVALPFTGIRDEAAMVLVGAALIGLGAAVRRAS